MRSLAAVIVFAAICATGALGQNSFSGGVTPSGFSGSAGFSTVRPAEMRSVTGAPYSAEESSEQVQTLADGTHITRKSDVTKTYRDSAGRTRIERSLFRGARPLGRTQESPIIVEITDPVAQVKYTLDPINKVAHRQQFQPLQPRRVATGALPGTVVSTTSATSGRLGAGGGAASLAIATPQTEAIARPEITSENLGTRTIEGVTVQGTRTTSTWPVNSQGNDRPISVVSERWFSSELQLTVLSTSNDPRSGENTQKLTNISQSEPSPTLFQPPPDYSVVDESGPFTIKWGSQQ